MNGFSTADGFVEITESLGEMIKYVANEPSVGLFYVQQHAQNAVPNLVALNNNVTEKSRTTTLHTQDLDDSVTMVRSMKEHGLPIAGDMIKDIKSSLLLMSSKQPQTTPSLGLMAGRRGSWAPSAWGQTAVNASHDNEKSISYLSTVFKSAKQKARKLKWPQLDSIEPVQTTNEKPPRPPDVAEAIEPWQMPYSSPCLPETVAAVSVSPEVEVEELPPSSEIFDAQQERIPYDGITWKCKVSPELENYDVFRANKEAKLKMWLEGTGNMDCKEANVLEEP